jgi:hypothetical protein
VKPLLRVLQVAREGYELPLKVAIEGFLECTLLPAATRLPVEQRIPVVEGLDTFRLVDCVFDNGDTSAEEVKPPSKVRIGASSPRSGPPVMQVPALVPVTTLN